MNIKELLEAKRNKIELIKDAREEIADIQKKKIIERAVAWNDAEGTVDAKKDYVRSIVADYDKEISLLESDIEYYYNQIDWIHNQLVYMEDE